MKKAVISNRIYMNRTPQLHEDLKKELTYTLPSPLPGRPNIQECEVTRVNKDIITIPSGRLDLIPSDYEIVDKRVEVPVTFPSFKFILRPSQKEVYDNFTESSILNANTSYGKTFTAIAMAAKVKQKTVVIVHTKFLLEQWKSEILKTLNIHAGIIGGGEYDIDSIITIAMVQSLKNKINKLTKEFGLIIVDETHHLPAPVFKEIVDKFKAKYRLGLSATLWRKDGRHQMLYDYFGGKNNVFIPKDENSLKPKIIMLETGIKFNSNGAIPWPTRISELYNNVNFIELVVNVSEIYANNGYLVLTVSDRVDFLRTCADVIDNAKLIVGTSIDRDIVSSGKNPIFGSSKIFSEGINIPPLDCLVLAMCINNRTLLEQLIGRICRIHLNKKNPIVIDFMLKGNTGKNQAAKRINYYMEKGYKIEYIKV